MNSDPAEPAQQKTLSQESLSSNESIPTLSAGELFTAPALPRKTRLTLRRIGWWGYWIFFILRLVILYAAFGALDSPLRGDQAGAFIVTSICQVFLLLALIFGGIYVASISNSIRKHTMQKSWVYAVAVFIPLAVVMLIVTFLIAYFSGTVWIL